MGTSRLRDALLDPRALAVPIFLYGCARAALLSITHDEALTYLFHVRAPWGAVLAHSAPLPSNNHLLNTLAVKALVTWLPPSELVLRLPALLGLAIYLWAAARLTARTTSGVRRPLGFLLIAANPFVLDLLIVCRGYALALGLSLAAVALVIADDASPGTRRTTTASLAALAAALAVAANLAFLYAFVGLAALVAWSSLRAPRPAKAESQRGLAAFLASVAPFAIAGALLPAIYTPHVLAKIQRVVSSWGGERGVWRDTVATLIDGTLYGASWFAPAHAVWIATLIALTVVFVAGGALLACLPARNVNRSDTPSRPLTASVFLVVAWMLQVVAAHYLLAARYPLERAASALLPLMTLTFVLLWEDAARRGGGRAMETLGAACAVAAGAALLHFAACANLSRTYLWRVDADARPAMRLVAAAAAPAPPGALRLGVSWQLEPAANFYRVTRGLTGLAPVTRDDLRTGFDLYLLAGDDASMVATIGLRTCTTFPVSGSLLAAPAGLPCPFAR